jgi:NaMN:DMB phosphoribosyltransferase
MNLPDIPDIDDAFLVRRLHSGAALAWPLLVSACAVLNEMATFDSAQVSAKSG